MNKFKLQSLWKTVCVKSCPKEGDMQLDCSPNSVITHCSGNGIEVYESTDSKNDIN